MFNYEHKDRQKILKVVIVLCHLLFIGLNVWGVFYEQGACVLFLTIYIGWSIVNGVNSFITWTEGGEK